MRSLQNAGKHMAVPHWLLTVIQVAERLRIAVSLHSHFTDKLT